MRCRRAAIVGNVPAQFKPARDLLRMVSFYARAHGKIRWTAQNEVKISRPHTILPRPENHRGGFHSVPPAHCNSQIYASSTLPACASTVTNRAPGSRHAAIIPTEPIPLPKSSAVRVRTPGGPVPCRQNIIRGKPMPVAKLKKPEVPADGIQSFAFRDDKVLIQSAGRD